MKFIIKNLFRRKLRTLFSVLGVGIGVSIMVALFTISDDLVGQISEAFETQRGDLVVTQATAEELESDIPLYHMDEIRGLEGVQTVTPMIAAFLRTENDFDDRPAILYYGITGDNPVLAHMQMVEGEPVSDDDPYGVVFGEHAYEILREKMGDKVPKVGQPLNLLDVVTSEGFEQVFGRPDNWNEMSEQGKQWWALIRLTTELGIHPDAIEEESSEAYEARTGRKAPPRRPIHPLTGMRMDDTQYTKWLKDSYDIDYDALDPVYAWKMKLQLTTRGVCRTGIMIQDSAVWFHLKVAQVLKGKHARTETVKVKEGRKFVEKQVEVPESCTNYIVIMKRDGVSEEQLEANILKAREYINVNMRELRAIKSADILQRHKELDFFEQFGLVISLVAALAGAVGILNTMTLTVYERTREIGLLLAVGWSRGRVLSSVMLEGLLLSILGGLMGVAFGYAEVQAAREWFAMDALSGALNIKRSLHAVGLAFGIGFLASLYPAIRASLMEPIDALRHE